LERDDAMVSLQALEDLDDHIEFLEADDIDEIKKTKNTASKEKDGFVDFAKKWRYSVTVVMLLIPYCLLFIYAMEIHPPPHRWGGRPGYLLGDPPVRWVVALVSPTRPTTPTMWWWMYFRCIYKQ
jgi:hypothetical protein